MKIINKFQISLVMTALIISVITVIAVIQPISTSSASGSSGLQPDCIIGPGSCGCYVSTATCQTTWVQTSDLCSLYPVKFDWKYQKFDREIYQFGERIGGFRGETTRCSVNQPPDDFPICTTTCG